MRVLSCPGRFTPHLSHAAPSRRGSPACPDDDRSGAEGPSRLGANPLARATSPDRLVSDGPTVDAHWEPHRVYFVGDTVVDALLHATSDGADTPSPPGRFRALVDHY